MHTVMRTTLYTLTLAASALLAAPAHAQELTPDARIHTVLDWVDAIRTQHQIPLLDPLKIQAFRTRLAPPGEPPTDENLRTITQEINTQLNSAYTGLEATLHRHFGCANDWVYCLELPANTGYRNDKRPETARPGDAIQVKLLVPIGDATPYTLTVQRLANRQIAFKPSTSTKTGVRDGDASKPPPPRADKSVDDDRYALLEALEALEATRARLKARLRIQHAASTTLVVSDDPRIDRLTFHVDGGELAGLPESIAIDHGEYFFDVGLLIPVAWNAERTLTLRAIDAQGQRRVDITRDHDITPAIVINAYPAGRAVNRIGTFIDGQGDVEWDWSAFGVQIGLDLLLEEPLDRLYFGALFEPVSGFALSAGCAFMRRDGLPAGIAEGDIIGPDDTLTPTRSYAPSFYFGITLSTELITASRALASSLAGGD